MMTIPCPHCGPRDETEFESGGQASISYPDRPADLDDRSWAEFLFVRENPRGWLTERWTHRSGCRQWFIVERHTVTNEIVSSGSGW